MSPGKVSVNVKGFTNARHTQVRSSMKPQLILAGITLAPIALFAQRTPSAGALSVIDKTGNLTLVCPLKRTEVKAEISGFLSRVTVTQNFENPLKEKIEAVYTFPLPQNSAVDRMTMHIGE